MLLDMVLQTTVVLLWFGVCFGVSFYFAASRCDDHTCSISSPEKNSDSQQQEVVCDCAFPFDCHQANTVRQDFTKSSNYFWGVTIAIAVHKPTISLDLA